MEEGHVIMWESLAQINIEFMRCQRAGMTPEVSNIVAVQRRAES